MAAMAGRHAPAASAFPCRIAHVAMIIIIVAIIVFL